VKLFLIHDAAAIPARKLLNCEFKRELQVGRAKGSVQKYTQPLGSEYPQRRFTPVEVKCAEQAGDSVEMVAVQVADEDRMNAAAFHARSHQLQLCAFAAVEQENIAFAHQCRGGQTSSE